MILNPFYMKKIARIIATQRSIILRLPFHVTNILGLNFHNFNPKASPWVDRYYKENFFKLFPESINSMKQRQQDILLRLFRVRVLPRRTLLLEEGCIAREVVIMLSGEVELYRRLPNSKQPAKIGEQNIPLDNVAVGV